MCKNKLPIIDNLVEECINIVDGETFYEKTLDDCILYIALYIGLLVSVLVISVASRIFIYFYCYKKKEKSDTDKVNYSNIGKINY